MFTSNFAKKFLISAEIHYFRLSPEYWEDRIMKAKEAGCGVISSYIPWIVHEEVEREYQFDGWYDLRKFLELIEKNDMQFIARPGPFVMAELKNEGIPFWVYEKYPHIIPLTWDGKKVENSTVVYNHPDFLKEVKLWYLKVASILKPFVDNGVVCGIQIDNEIGMLQWINNTPDLSDFTLSRFVEWVVKNYGEDRYGFPLDFSSKTFMRLRNPEKYFRDSFISDYSKFIRKEFSRYVSNLIGFFHEFGIDTNFLLNVHGTAGGKAHTFPIGISQLEVAYKENDVIPTTDVYLGTLSVRNFHDLWNINEIVKSTNKKTLYGCMEFECGDGNYGNDYGERILPESILHKLLLSVIQGNKLINYYLFAGGINSKL
ncbi:MAG: beta-galactosidase, partial [Fervidobacterium sp.]